MLNNLSNKKIVKKHNGKLKKDKVLDRLQNESLDKLILAGNKISQGNAPVGEVKTDHSDIFERYLIRIPDIIRKKWMLPSFLINKKFKCRIQIFLAGSGKILEIKILQSSGNKIYDLKAVEAVKKTKFLPALPKEIANRGLSGDIILGFPL